MHLTNLSPRQADFLVLHLAEGRAHDRREIFELFRKMFLAADCPILFTGSKRGKVVRYSSGTPRKVASAGSDSSIELYGGTNPFAYRHPPSSWKLMSAFFPKRDGMLMIGKAASALGGKLDEGWVNETLAACESVADVRYGYAYGATLPHGAGYACGFYQADDFHDVPAADDEADRIQRWSNALHDQKAAPYLRDVFPINIFSQEKLDATKVTSLGRAVLATQINRQTDRIDNPRGRDLELPESLGRRQPAGCRTSRRRFQSAMRG